MAETVLLTIGRLPKALDFARAFAQHGYRVIVADPFRWHLTRVSNAVDRSYRVAAPASDRLAYLNDLLDIIAKENVSLVVPVSEETMYVTGLRDRLPPAVRMFSMPQNVVLKLHDKKRFIETAASYGLDVPETLNLTDQKAATLAAQGDYVVKPVFSCSGRGVRFFAKGAPLPSCANDEPEIVQARVSGDLFSTFSIAHNGVTRSTVVYRAAMMSGTVAVSFERICKHLVIENWVERFIAASTYTGFISFDMIVNSDGRAYAIECNPRATSGVHFLNTEDLVPAVVDAASAIKPAFKPNRFMQQFYPCLTETQKSFFKSERFRSNLRQLFSARDVTWSIRDPLPLLLMPITSSQIIWRSIVKKQSFGEASTFDISWSEPPNACSAQTSDRR